MSTRTPVDPLACRACTHKIEQHHPAPAAGYASDTGEVCVGSGYKLPYGVVCPCRGFTVALRAQDNTIPPITPRGL